MKVQPGVPDPSEPILLRRADNNERFVAFAFAAADFVVEVEPGGEVTYAAGALRARFARAPEEFVGSPVHDMVDPLDHPSLDMALLVLAGKGRLSPVLIRLADCERTQLALAGLVLSPVGCPVRLCLTFSVLPAAPDLPHMMSSLQFARTAARRLQAATPHDLGLVEVTSHDCDAASLGIAISSALQTVVPHAVASEVAPGRYGLLGIEGQSSLPAVAAALEAALRAQRVAPVEVTSRSLLLSDDGLTPAQAARALRQALSVFARNGAAGLDDAVFAGGLAGYVQQAAAQTGALRQAIIQRRFELLFQPVVTLADRKLHHYEALLRPKPIPGCPFGTPQEFVTLVEALGLTDELDLAVVGLACDAALVASVPVAFNLSGQSVQSAAFRDRLIRQLSAHPACRAGRLLAEMTETAEVEDVEEVSRTAIALRGINVPFCLDDFGAGAADVRVLRAIPADIVKLDGSYVPGAAQGGRERAFVAGIIAIARAAGAEVVAERIETEAKCEALAALGAAYGQGWLFGRPAPLPTADQPERRVLNGRRRGEKESWG